MRSRVGEILVAIIVLSLAPAVWGGEASTTSATKEAIVYRERGYRSQTEERLEEAILWYRRAIAEDPEYAAPHNDLGTIYEGAGLPGEAEKEYLRALEIDPDYASAHSNLALLYEGMGKFEEAIYHWIRRIELGGRDEPWVWRAKEELVRLGREGIEVGEGSVKEREQPIHSPTSLGIWAGKRNKELARRHFNKGLAYYKKKQYERASAHFELALTYDPTSIETTEYLERSGELARSMARKGKGRMGPEIVISTEDIKRDYEVLDLLTCRVEGGDTELVNDRLKEKAEELGADGVILVKYISRGEELYGYGTAVKLK